MLLVETERKTNPKEKLKKYSAGIKNFCDSTALKFGAMLS
jgi:hypothetical protein